MESSLIDSLEISSKEFCKLVRVSKHKKTLFFSDIKLIINSQFDFGEMRNCKIEIFKIGYYYKVYNDLNEYGENLIWIFKTIL